MAPTTVKSEQVYSESFAQYAETQCVSTGLHSLAGTDGARVLPGDLPYFMRQGLEPLDSLARTPTISSRGSSCSPVDTAAPLPPSPIPPSGSWPNVFGSGGLMRCTNPARAAVSTNAEPRAMNTASDISRNLEEMNVHDGNVRIGRNALEECKLDEDGDEGSALLSKLIGIYHGRSDGISAPAVCSELHYDRGVHRLYGSLSTDLPPEFSANDGAVENGTCSKHNSFFEDGLSLPTASWKDKAARKSRRYRVVNVPLMQ